jgi:hypothetical protein
MTKQEESYAALVESMKELYEGGLSDVEAHEAARNLIAFVKIMLEIHAKSD